MVAVAAGRREAMDVAHEGLHEPPDLLDAATIDRHRALESLIEELEAIDWYDQRFHATQDPELASILAHNRDDEKEHAAMLLEWIRRQDPIFEAHLRTYLFRSGSIVAEEQRAEARGANGGDATARPSIGSLREGSR